MTIGRERKVGPDTKLVSAEPAGGQKIWGQIALAVGGAIIGQIGAERETAAEGEWRLDVAQENNRGALERQNDQQAFEEFLINRRSVGGGPAYGGPTGEMPNFFFGLEDQANGAGIAEFFKPLQEGGGQVQQRPRSPLNTLAWGDQSRLDPETALSYQSRDEYNNPLYNLRRFLGVEGEGTERNPDVAGGT